MDTTTSEHKFVLLADDDADDRMFFEEAIEEIEININLTTVKDGQELMDFLNHSTFLLPEILFLDLNMPFKNGLQCLREIRAEERYIDICIVLYSTTARQADIDECYDLGANLFINKPNSFADLKKLLMKVFTMDLKECHKDGKEAFVFRL
jgi:CheY-like chemotaxis protein